MVLYLSLTRWTGTFVFLTIPVPSFDRAMRIQSAKYPPLPFAVSTKIFSTGGREVSLALELYDIRVEGGCAVRYVREDR